MVASSVVNILVYLSWDHTCRQVGKEDRHGEWVELVEGRVVDVVVLAVADMRQPVQSLGGWERPMVVVAMRSRSSVASEHDGDAFAFQCSNFHTRPTQCPRDWASPAVAAESVLLVVVVDQEHRHTDQAEKMVAFVL